MHGLADMCQLCLKPPSRLWGSTDNTSDQTDPEEHVREPIPWCCEICELQGCLQLRDERDVDAGCRWVISEHAVREYQRRQTNRLVKKIDTVGVELEGKQCVLNESTLRGEKMHIRGEGCAVLDTVEID